MSLEDDWVTPAGGATHSDDDWLTPGGDRPSAKVTLPPAERDEGTYRTAVKPEPQAPTPEVDDFGRPIDTSQSPGPKPVTTYDNRAFRPVEATPPPLENTGGVDDLGRPIDTSAPKTTYRDWQSPWGKVTLPYEPEEQKPGQTPLGAGAAAAFQSAVKGVGSGVAGVLTATSNPSGKEDFSNLELTPEETKAATEWRHAYEAKQREIASGIVEGSAALAKHGAPIDPTQREGFAVKLGGAIGSAVPFVGALAIGGLPAGALFGFGSGYQEEFDKAKQAGATDADAHNQGFLGGAVNAAMLDVPGAAYIHGLPELIKQPVMNWAARATVHSGLMVTQGQLTQAAGNLFAGRPLTEGLGDLGEMGAQAIVGAGLGMGSEAIRGRLQSRAMRAAAPDMTGMADQITPPTPAASVESTPPPASTPSAPETAATPPGQLPPTHLPDAYMPPPAAPPDPVAGAHQTLQAIAATGQPETGAQSAPPAPPAPPVPPPAPELGSNLPPRNEPSSASPVESNPAGGYTMLDPGQIKVDPARFQFKASDPEKGVTGALSGTTKWEPLLANPITTWQDNSGQHWVANGHQRHDLATRAQAAGQEGVQMPARVFREADGYTPEDMKTLGAYQNIAEGSGTAIDAAKIMRQQAAIPGRFEMPSLPPRSQLVRDATGLTKLSDEAFGAVVNGVVDPAYAAHVGALITDPAEQVSALQMLARADPKNSAQARFMVEDMRNSGFLKDTQISLFGDEAFAKSLVPERARVLDAALRTLRGNKRVFRAAVDGEDTLTAAGNTLDSAGNAKARTENERLIDHLERNATTKGPLSDALSAAATDLAGGKPSAAVVSQFLGQARADARSDVGRTEGAPLQHSDHDGGAGQARDGQAEGQEPPVEGQGGFFEPGAPMTEPKHDWTPGGGGKTAQIGKTAIDYGVSRDGKSAEVILVKTPPADRGKGEARRAMQEFIGEADQQGKTLFLNADPMGKSVSKSKLDRFYRSLGFVKNMGRNKDFSSRAEFVRRPKPFELSEPRSDKSSAGDLRTSKPQDAGKLAEDFFGGGKSAARLLAPVDAGVLATLHHDQVVQAVVRALPVDVMHELASHSIDPEIFARDPKVLGNRFPVDRAVAIREGLAGALAKTRAELRAGLDAAEKASLNPEVLPALRASDLSLPEIAGIALPERFFDSGRGDVHPPETNLPAETATPLLRAETDPTTLTRLGEWHDRIMADVRGDVTNLEQPKGGKINARGQDDMFAPKRDTPRPEATPPKPGGQTEMFPTNDAAKQAQAARDQAGPRDGQKPADQGLFAHRPEGQGDLAPTFKIARSQLGGAYAAWKKIGRRDQPHAGRDVTNEVLQRADVPGQTTAADFVAERGKASGHEYLTVVDNASGDVIHAQTNNLDDRVGFDGAALRGRPPDSITVHHNHPGSSSFSGADLKQLGFPAMGHMVAVAKNGDVFIASAGDRFRYRRTYDNSAPHDAMGRVHEQTKNDAARRLQQMVNNREVDVDAANASFYDVVARMMHADGHINYTSTRALPPVIAHALEQHFTVRGRNPSEISAALRVVGRDEAMASLPQRQTGTQDGNRADTNDRPAQPVRPGGGTDRLLEGIRGRSESPRPAGGPSGAQATERSDVGADARKGRLGTPSRGLSEDEAPVKDPSRLDRFIAKARDHYETGREALVKGMTDLISPIAGGSSRAMAIAQQFANALRGVTQQFKFLDDHLVKNYKPEQRLAMGKAMDEQSVLEQEIRKMRDANAASAQGQLGATPTPHMSPAELAAAETSMRQQWGAAGKGIESLPAEQKAVVQQLAALADRVWTRMQGRGLVDASARGLPYYFARTVLQVDEHGNTVKSRSPSGTGSDINGIGKNLTTAGPQRRKYLTAEDTLANAKLALNDPNAFLLQDIRAVPSALARNERAIAGKDLIDAIQRIGVATGNNTVLHGEIPNGQNPGDYFTIGHPSFQQFTGTGFKSIHVAKEFEGPLRAVLTSPTHPVFRGIMKAKGASMSAIMWSPLMHLNVELGRALPLMRGKLVSAKFWQDGARLSRDPGYMQTATNDGLAPIAQSWRGDPASLYDQSDPNKQPGALGRAAESYHNFHQKILWDTIFKLQTGIYDSMRTKLMNKDFDARTAGIMAAHFANRYAGALPTENLRQGANIMANLFLFSRSFTLGNLAVMKDCLNGMPRQTVAMIQQEMGSDVADRAVSVARRKAWAAVGLDIGLAIVTNQIVQQGAAALQRAPSMGVGPAVQSVFDEWLEQAKAALEKTGTTYDPRDLLGVLPTANNEPHKKARALLGKDEQGRGIYARLAVGKVGEEFMGWPTTPAEMLFAKMSPWTRPLWEDMQGTDTLGRKLYDPDASWMEKLGASVKHVAAALGPVDQVKGAYQLVKQMSGHGDAGADPWVQAFRTFLPATGLGSLSSGFPGGPEAGQVFNEKQSLAYRQQQAMPEARQLYKNGDGAGAMKLLRESGMLPKDALRALRYMNQSVATAGSMKWAAKHENQEQRQTRGLVNTGRPLSERASSP